MASSLEAEPVRRFDRIALPETQDVLDLIDRSGAAAAPFDASYGDTLAQLLPRRLSELAARSA
jgi:hypothetical protein